MNKNYFIKKNYTPFLSQNNSLDKNRPSQDNYWSAYRLKLSRYFQAHVYLYLSKKISSTHSVLDVGCGTGAKLAEYILPITKDITGIDCKSIILSLKKNKKLETVNWIAADIESSNLDLKKKFDFIICADVIEHLEDPDKVITLIKKHMHKNSIIIFSTPDRDKLRGKDCTKSEKPEHIREWNKNEFSQYIQHHNFKILEHFHQKPLKFHISIAMVYFKIFFNKFLNKKTSFKYNQVLVCEEN